ncbi:SAM-dependent methyltransferase [Pedobacter sp. UYP30]|uniref:class I SAM-dependent methyltransferase n=1 Tax=Pedobacter sp. UYP30 TaxID=1756400 RepID=UPI003392F907
MDVFGSALLDFYHTGKADRLVLHNSYAEPEEMPVDLFFRDEEEMPDLEINALHLCKGKILDVGAGVGSHALVLQNFNVNVTAVDISEIAVKIMKQRGVKQAIVADILHFTPLEKYDTILMLMNGIGLTGSLKGFEKFISDAKKLLNVDGQMLFDSSDISYLYEDLPKPTSKYFGEVSYQYEYKGEKGSWFNWVYLDKDTIIQVAERNGWYAKILLDDGEDQFLVQLSLTQSG